MLLHYMQWRLPQTLHYDTLFMLTVFATTGSLYDFCHLIRNDIFSLHIPHFLSRSSISPLSPFLGIQPLFASDAQPFFLPFQQAITSFLFSSSFSRILLFSFRDVYFAVQLLWSAPTICCPPQIWEASRGVQHESYSLFSFS